MGWGNIIGGAIGSFFGPVGTAAGSAIGGAIEGAVTDDDRPEATRAPAAAQNFDPAGGTLANFRTTGATDSPQFNNGGCCANGVNPSQVNGLPEEMRGFISAIANLLNQLGQMLQRLFQGQSDQGGANSPTGNFPAISPPSPDNAQAYNSTAADNGDQTNALSDINGMMSFVTELFSMEAQISFNRSSSQGIAA